MLNVLRGTLSDAFVRIGLGDDGDHAVCSGTHLGRIGLETIGVGTRADGWLPAARSTERVGVGRSVQADVDGWGERIIGPLLGVWSMSMSSSIGLLDPEGMDWR